MYLYLITHEVVHEGGDGIPVPADGHALVDAVRGLGYYVVQLVGHATGPKEIFLWLLIKS